MHKSLQICAFGITSLLIIILNNSCEVINPDDPVPSYINVQKIEIESSYGQGSERHKISDVWLSLNGVSAGAYELPAEFPVLAEGSQTLKIRPGIKLNGISSTRVYYPFVNTIELDANLIKGETIYLDSIANLKTTYKSNIVFSWNDIGQEDFEEGGISIDSISGSLGNMQKTNTEVFEGDYSGHIHLTDSASKFILRSLKAYDLPTNSTPVFLEFHYKNDVPFQIGLYSNYITTSTLKDNLIVINPKDEWNKMYFNLTPYVNQESSAIDFNIIFKAELSSGEHEGNIYLDNIKLVHQEQ